MATEIPLTPVAPPYVLETSTNQLTTFSLTATDNVNGNVVNISGCTLFLFLNTDAGAQTVTIQSSPDDSGRVADITAFSIPAGSYAARTFTPKWWEQNLGGGNITLTTSSANIEFAAIPQSCS